MICACSYHTKTLYQILPKQDNGTDRQTKKRNPVYPSLYESGGIMTYYDRDLLSTGI